MARLKVVRENLLIAQNHKIKANKITALYNVLYFAMICGILTFVVV